LILPGYFAGAVLVFIWSFTDLGSPLVFGYSRVVPVQIFDAVNDLNTNPVGYALVLVVLGLTLGLFLAAKRCFGGRRYEMMSRGHVGSGPVRANARQTAWVWLGLGALLGLSLLPHLMVLVQSLGRGWFMRVLPAEWTLANYGAVFGHGLTLSSIRNSLFYSALSAGLDLVLGVAIAWLLTRRRVPLAGWLDALAMLPLALPGLVLAFGYVGGFDLPSVLPTGLRETVADWRTASAGGLGEAFWSFGWLNPRTNPTLLLVVSYSVRRLPYIVRSAYAGFQQTSVTLEEASASLGASPWHTLRRITLPLIAANLVAGTILTFAFAMLEVSDSLILAMRQQYFPITKMLWGLLGRLEPDAPGVACALGVLGMLILGACLFAASRFMGRRLGQLFRV
jgi:iron(III) transport system permease protein